MEEIEKIGSKMVEKEKQVASLNRKLQNLETIMNEKLNKIVATDRDRLTLQVYLEGFRETASNFNRKTILEIKLLERKAILISFKKKIENSSKTSKLQKRLSSSISLK